jgi:hypothetical protein
MLFAPCAVAFLPRTVLFKPDATVNAPMAVVFVLLADASGPICTLYTPGVVRFEPIEIAPACVAFDPRPIAIPPFCAVADQPRATLFTSKE